MDQKRRRWCSWQAREQEQPNELRVTVANLQFKASQRDATTKHWAMVPVSRELQALGNGIKSVWNMRVTWASWSVSTISAQLRYLKSSLSPSFKICNRTTCQWEAKTSKSWLNVTTRCPQPHHPFLPPTSLSAPATDPVWSPDKRTPMRSAESCCRTRWASSAIAPKLRCRQIGGGSSWKDAFHGLNELQRFLNDSHGSSSRLIDPAYMISCESQWTLIKNKSKSRASSQMTVEAPSFWASWSCWKDHWIRLKSKWPMMPMWHTPVSYQSILTYTFFRASETQTSFISLRWNLSWLRRHSPSRRCMPSKSITKERSTRSALFRTSMWVWRFLCWWAGTSVNDFWPAFFQSRSLSRWRNAWAHWAWRKFFLDQAWRMP